MVPFPDASLSLSPSPEDHSRWHELLEELDPNGLTETFLSKVGQIPGYDPAPIPTAEIRRTGRLTFMTLIDQLRTDGIAEAMPVATDVGVSRARAGIPITSLMTAIRFDFTVLWEALTRIAGVSDAGLLVRHTALALRIVDEYAGHTQRAYLSERERMSQEAASVLQGVISRLFHTSPLIDEQLNSIAAELRLAREKPLTVVAATRDDSPALRVAISEIERVGGRVFTHYLDETLIAFLPRSEFAGSRLHEAEHRLESLRVGFTAAPLGLAGVRLAAETARDLSNLLATADMGPMTWSRGWARLASLYFVEHSTPVLSDVTEALATCGQVEQARLREAVETYLRSGSISEAAASLYCHRNTIANRLRRFAEVTGVDPTVPVEAARLVVGWALTPHQPH